MKVYSDKLRAADLYACANAIHGLSVYELKEARRPTKRQHSYTVVLESLDETRRKGNSGGYGAADYHAPTWDEYGLWIDALFNIDPQAIIGPYDGRSDFYNATKEFVTNPYGRKMRLLANGEKSQYGREHSAPWLTRDAVA